MKHMDENDSLNNFSYQNVKLLPYFKNAKLRKMEWLKLENQFKDYWDTPDDHLLMTIKEKLYILAAIESLSKYRIGATAEEQWSFACSFGGSMCERAINDKENKVRYNPDKASLKTYLDRTYKQCYQDAWKLAGRTARPKSVNTNIKALQKELETLFPHDISGRECIEKEIKKLEEQFNPFKLDAPLDEEGGKETGHDIIPGNDITPDVAYEQKLIARLIKRLNNKMTPGDLNRLHKGIISPLYIRARLVENVSDTSVYILDGSPLKARQKMLEANSP